MAARHSFVICNFYLKDASGLTDMQSCDRAKLEKAYACMLSLSSPKLCPYYCTSTKLHCGSRCTAVVQSHAQEARVK
eukprot:scaffold132098_cov36-Prasinocladus_malaysianus.AAC.2